MKTSYKIITAFIIIMFTALFTTSISLKAKYKNGDFNIPEENNDDIFAQGDLYKVELSNFKNVVINSSIVTKNGRKVNFNSNLIISSSNKNNVLGIPKTLSSMLRTSVSNDTLYISFQKNTINKTNLDKTYFQNIIIEAKDLRSLNVKNLICTVNAIQTGQPFTLIADSATVNLAYVKTTLLNLKIGTKSAISFNGYGVIKKDTGPPKVDNLTYTLGQGSSITIANKELIGKIKCLAPSKNVVEGYSKSLNIVNISQQ